MLKMLLGASAAIGLLLAATTALGHPHQPASSHDKFERVGRPTADHVRSTPVERTKAHAADAKQVIRSTGSSPAASRQQRVANCSEFATCNGSSAKPRTNATSSAKASKSTSSSSPRAASESYLAKAYLAHVKELKRSWISIEKMGCNNGTNCWDL
jgi:hypothetical protein